jgi:predicted esterase
MKSCATIFLLFVLTVTGFPKPDPVIYMPKSGGQHLKVAVWLQGYRGYPGIIRGGYFQDFADRLNIAIVGFPATTNLSDHTQQWSEEPSADHAYLQERLATLAQKHDLDVSRVALFGFSQGAMVAADLCSRFPNSYSGAIVMSPGGIGNPQTAITPAPEHKNQIFWVVCMADEHPGNVELTRQYAKHLETLGSKVTKIEYPGIKEHTRPPDFDKRFPDWIGTILNIKERKEHSE